MHKSGEIRVITLGLIERGDEIFVSQGYDPVKGEYFYRFLGGGVEFGEPSQEALIREFHEELQAELREIKYLGCWESIFEFSGQKGHELILLYRCSFVDPKFYELDSLMFAEGKRQKTALWVSLERFKSGELRLVPESLLGFILES